MKPSRRRIRSHAARILAGAVALVGALSMADVASAASADISPILHVQNEYSALCARVPMGSTAVDVQLDQDTCADKTNREWRWSPLYGTDRKLVNVHSGLCLTYFGNGTKDGPAVQAPCSATFPANQIWQPTTLISDWSDRYQVLLNPASKRCLAPVGGSGESYVHLVVTACNYGDEGQRWHEVTSVSG